MSKTTKESVSGGMATVHVGMKLSANYQTTDVQIGLTLPLEPGEGTQAALTRVHREVDKYFAKAAPMVMETVAKVRASQKTKERHG